MDVLDYIKDLNEDVKLIIFSFLHIDILSKTKIQQNISDTVFKYRYASYYTKVKDIIKLNRSLKFEKYIEEGPYFWKILLNDKLKLEKMDTSLYSLYSGMYNSWKYFNIISVDIEIMIIFNQVFPLYYSYLSNFLEDKHELYLLNYSFNPYLGELYVGAKYSMAGADTMSRIIKILTTGQIERIEVDVDEYSDMLDEGDEGFDLIVKAYFLSQFIPKDYLILPVEDMKHYIETLRDQTRAISEYYIMYDNFHHIIDKYMEFLES